MFVFCFANFDQHKSAPPWNMPEWYSKLYRFSYLILVSRIAFKLYKYRQIASKSHIKSQNLNASRLVLHLSLPNQFKPGVKSWMKM